MMSFCTNWMSAMCVTLIAGALGAGCQRDAAAPVAAVSADTWAVVDGRQITRDEVEKAYRRTGQNTPPASEEETLAAKLTLLNDLIVQDVLLAKARELKIELPESELDAAYAEAKKNIPDETFQQEIAKRNLSAADMRDGLRRELLAQKVVEREIGAKTAVTDREVEDFFSTNRAQFNLAEDAYHIAQIVVAPGRTAQLSNRTGDDAATPQEATAKTQMLMERLKAGASFSELALGYSEDPESAPRGGDLGFVPISALQRQPPPLRDAVLKAAPGTVNVVSGGGAHTIVLVVAQEKAGQRDLSTPNVRERITGTLRGRKEQLLRAAYLTTVRTDAKVNNYLARRLVESPTSLPSLAPTAPAAK